jgi:hypothetical protein
MAAPRSIREVDPMTNGMRFVGSQWWSMLVAVGVLAGVGVGVTGCAMAEDVDEEASVDGAEAEAEGDVGVTEDELWGSDPAPSCVTYWVEPSRLEDYRTQAGYLVRYNTPKKVHVANRCGSAQRVGVDIPWSPDTTCRTIRAGGSTTWAIGVNDSVRKIKRC